MTSDDERATPTLNVTPHPIFEWRVDVELVGSSEAHYVVWGDGKANDVAADAAMGHSFPSFPAAWQVQVFKADRKTLLTHKLVVVRGGRAPIGYEIGRNPENSSEVEIRFIDTGDNTGVLPQLRIEWPKTKDAVTAWAAPGGKVTRSLSYGDHIVGITDLTSHRSSNEQVHVAAPDYDPDYTLRRKAGGDPHTAELEVTKVTSTKTVVIGWGAEIPAEEHKNVKVGDTFTHTYPEPPAGESKRYLVSAGYSDETGQYKATGISVPLS